MSDKFAGRSNTLPPIHKRFDLIWLDTTLSTEAKMVAISIVFRIGSDRNGKAFPSRERIARDWSISDRQVTRGFKQIRKRGFFSSLPKPGGRNIKQWSWKYTDAEITVGVEQLRQQLDAERKSKKTLETAAGNLDQQSTFASNVDHDSTLGTLDRQSRLATSVDQESRHPGLSVQTSVDHQSSRIAKPKSQAKSLHASGQLSNDAGTQGQEARGASQASPQPPSIPDTPSSPTHSNH